MRASHALTAKERQALARSVRRKSGRVQVVDMETGRFSVLSCTERFQEECEFGQEFTRGNRTYQRIPIQGHKHAPPVVEPSIFKVPQVERHHPLAQYTDSKGIACFESKRELNEFLARDTRYMREPNIKPEDIPRERDK